MSNVHLDKESAQPPKVESKLRLYSMLFCPFAERVRLVLLLKKIPHDVVNVNLQSKPDWLLKLHPEGTVPILDTGLQILVESVDICNYLEKQYPDPPLYPTDLQKCEEDKALIQNFSKLVALYYKAVLRTEDKTFKEHFRGMLPHLIKLENELKERGIYFGGSEPNMVDYLLWPFGERAPALGLAYKERIPDETVFPNLYTWCNAMRTQECVIQTVISPERLCELNLQYLSGNPVQYDSI